MARTKHKYPTRGGKTAGFYRVELKMGETIKYQFGTGLYGMTGNRLHDPKEAEAYAIDVLQHLSSLTSDGFDAELVGITNDGPRRLAVASEGLVKTFQSPQKLTFAELRLFD